ncbi:MAG: hypothetical protein ACFFBD_10330 [Candidatus Hodarchaeota archaeon]
MSDSKNVHPIVEEALNLAKIKQTITQSDSTEQMFMLFFGEEAIEKLKESLSEYFHTRVFSMQL